MDYTNVCKGWIYCITNITNGKRYVGQTVDYNTRKDRHLKYHNDEKSVLHKAIAKYGSEKFEMVPIIEFTAINEEVRRKVLDFLEVLYIKKYQTLTSQYGYNLTAGGGGMSGFHPSEEARKKMSESQKQSNICIENWKRNQYDARRAILLYNLNGIFYREYTSITSFLKEIGKRTNPIHEHVFKALNNPTHSAYGYLWRYKENNNFPIFIDPWVDPQWKQVYYYTKDNHLIAKYSCAREAAEKCGVKLRTVKSSLERPQTKRRRISNYWSFTPPKQ